MAAAENPSSPGSGNDEPYWKGTAAPEKFSVDASNNSQSSDSELEKSVSEKKKWLEEIDIERNGEVTVVEPYGEDSRQNSEISGDANILHQYPEVIAKLVQHYPEQIFREPVQDEVVVNQGQTMIDAYTPEIDEPLVSVNSSLREMVYAALGSGDPDRLKLQQNGKPEGHDVEAILEPGGNGEEIDAGGINYETADIQEEEYPDDVQAYNEKLVSLLDIAVGRGFDLPEIRNGELLIENRFEVDGVINFETAEEFIFERNQRKENELEGFKEETVYDMYVKHEDGNIEEKATYQETSMYLDGIDELEIVQENADYKTNGSRTTSPFNPAIESVAYLWTGNPLKAAERSMEAQRRWLEKYTA